MTLDSSGNVGINTASPASRLHIKDATSLRPLVTNSGISGTYDTYCAQWDNSASLTFQGRTEQAGFGANWYEIETDSATGQATGHKWFTASSLERMRIDSSGNVGIGTSSPSGLLHIESSAPAFYMTDTTNNTDAVISVDNAGSLVFNADLNNEATSSNVRFAIDGTEHMRLDDSGRVGIGTGSAIDNNLHVKSSSSCYIKTERTGTSNLVIGSQVGENAIFSRNSSTGAFPLAFIMGGSEAMRIDTSGNLLVGDTAVPSGSNISVAINQSGQIKIGSNVSTSGERVEFWNSNGKVGTIVTNGTATAYNTSSDVRLKENIVDAPSASSDIDAIQIRSYDWKADGQHQKYGVIAQELVDVAPEAVSQGETEEDTWGVDYSKLVPMLVKELQELRARVAELEGA